MGIHRLSFISVVLLLFLTVLTEKTNSEPNGWLNIPASVDFLFQNRKGSQKGGTTRTSQSVFPTCPPCAHRKGPKAPVCEATLELGFIVESSNNIERVEPGSFHRLIQFVGLIVRKFSVSENKTRVGLVTYSSKPKLAFSLTGDISTIIKGLQAAKLHREPIANTGAAMKFAYHHFFSSSQRFNKVLVVITDGSSSDVVANVATAIKQKGIQIISVGVGRYFDIHQLDSMASRPSPNHVFTGQFNKIIHTRDEIVKTICLGVGGSYISPCKRPCLCKTG